MRGQIARGSYVALALGVLGLASTAIADANPRTQRLIIRAEKPYGGVVAAIRGMGGEVSHQFENVDAIAVQVPQDKVSEVLALQGVKVYRDNVVSLPKMATGGPREKLSGYVAAEGEGISAIGLGAAGGVAPADYLFNNSLIGATALHAQGNLGDGVIVGIIDSGTANSPVVAALQPGTVIGGESFVPGATEPGPTSRANGAHGTWVGTVIAGNAAFVVPSVSATSTFFPNMVASLRAQAPGSVIECATPPNNFACDPATQAVIPMVGVAPGAKIYALKVFPAAVDSTSDAIVIAAMDRAITLKRNFNHGVPSTPVAGDGSEDNPYRYDSLNLKVLNMSLGGPTLFAGRDLEDELTRKMLREGITLVASAGNNGFAAMTGGSPGTGIGALTVGAANTAIHERVLRDVQFGVGIGELYRPFGPTQTAYFSSRGPTADGRYDPEMTANGFATFAQGTCSGSPSCLAGTALAPFALVSGTSFSGPTAAGAAALLRKGAPWASATLVRNALSKGANRGVLGDGSGKIDQGSGFLDVAKSLDLLLAGRVSNRLATGIASPSVRLNTALLGFPPAFFRNNMYTTRVEDLKPGQVAQIFLPVEDRTDEFTVTIKNLTRELPPEQQNQLFGDDLLVQFADAPTSFLRDRFFDFVFEDTAFVVPNPQSGTARLAIQGDWTNAGKISADVVVERKRSFQGFPTAKGFLNEGEFKTVEFEVPAAAANLTVETFWDRDWARYPTDDLDLYLFDPAGNLVTDADGFPPGATLDSPERTAVAAPAAGTWTALIAGFTVHDLAHKWFHRHSRSNFVLRAKADGQRLPAN